VSESQIQTMLVANPARYFSGPASASAGA
jgi:predicted metal-dependent phosphotriesterase family hydrolase